MDSKDPPPCKTHPVFDYAEADSVILYSVEGTHFRVPCGILRRSSGFFRKLLVATEAGRKHIHPIPIPINAKEAAVERVLSMMCGLTTPSWNSFDELEDALSLIEEWNAPGPLSAIRFAITAPLFLNDPLRLYTLTTRFGWVEESKIAATHTLTLDLYEEIHKPLLERLSSKHLMALLGLHRRRRDEFRNLLDSEENFGAGNSPLLRCPGCGQEIDNYPWRELKSRMFMEMDKRPLGDNLTGLDMEEWPEAVACWNAKCRSDGCETLCYDKTATLREIKDCVDRLPSTL